VVLMRDLTPQGPQRSYISYVVLQNVRVLGIDLNADLASEKAATPNTATLEISVADSQKLSMAANLGTLSLALRRTGEADPAQARPLRTSDFLSGGGGDAAPAHAVYRGPARHFSAILIVEGEPSKHARTAKPVPAARTPSVAPAANPAAAGAQAGAAGVNAIG
jgi:pilus assembly protein CpaB